MIDQQTLDKIAALVADHGIDAETVPALRRVYPQLHFTFCSDDDVIGGPAPVHETEEFNLYLVDGRDHCMELTRDLSAATGVLIAAVTEEDEV